MRPSIFDLLQTGSVTDLVLDFDDTVCIHRDPPDYHEGPMRMARFRDCIEGTCGHYLELYRKGENSVLPGLRYLLELAKGTGVSTFVLSHSTLSIYLDAKQEWIDAVLGKGLIKRTIGVPSPEAKLKFLREYLEYRGSKRREGWPPARIAYIEDMPDLRLQASKMPDVAAFSPQDVAACWHELYEKSKGTTEKCLEQRP